MIYWLTFYLSRLFSLILFPFRVEGREHIPRNGGFILASNHSSYLDPVILGISFPRRMAFMARDSLFRSRCLGWYLGQLNTFPVKRESADIRSLREAIRQLRNQCPLVIFPEGTRKGKEGDKKILGGVGFIVAKARVPVIPVRILGSDQVLPPGAKWFRRYPICVIFGPPLRFSADTPYIQIAQSVMSSIDGMTPANGSSLGRRIS
jgi:1-acyl-sn-glycerol-3-phosphate acyltransferase